MKSTTLKAYDQWLDSADPEDAALVDAVYYACEQHYDAGGDTVVECFDPDDILAEFETVDDAREYCGIKVEQALNSRWGSDDDPELDTHRKFKEWKG